MDIYRLHHGRSINNISFTVNLVHVLTRIEATYISQPSVQAYVEAWIDVSSSSHIVKLEGTSTSPL